ncbi:MAG: nickel-dependent hydrogenase large subunit [Thiobacillus sp.]|jgi:coenzyme F420-reducing hydrogenase alpha subunit|uniref:Ni/Fe hydrogenase subunit alpha n=1 Tax=Thiobacillus sp. TaxID=924 RepID=UPI00289418E5|nr:nickel-dependent hydrogenase large subunit [Thiobacillus sp.]MDT3706465.1 nickel-dependent hydrogenase large subunit [Thiobacillus sp.]
MSELKRTVAVHVPVLARVEGEGALDLRIVDGEIAELRLRIFEPPRFFEKFLEGRHYTEIPDMVARICGICPVAYQATAAQALEHLFGVELSPWARDMRRVFYCGEWIQSHSLHIHLLAAPDFFGCNSVIELARIAPDAVRRGLRIQALGNELMDVFGARSVHPVGVRIGGFHGAPSLARIRTMREKLRAALPEAEALIRWAAGIAVPQDDQAFVSVAMRHPDDYAIERGGIGASDGLHIGADAYADHFTERQEPHSTALYSDYRGQPYLVGPLARLNLNHDRLPERVRMLLAETGLVLPSRNLFHSLVARAVEILLALHEALRLLDGYREPDSPWVPVTPRAGVAYGCTEAPRGLLWHRYEMDADGRVVSARIVPPTSQNQGRIEADLRLSLLNFGLDHPDDALRLHCEKVIRNYDPCISCATHFLALNIGR